MKRILVIGGGFAGLWAATAAVRRLDELGIGSGEIEVSLLNRDGYHSIRVRNYEVDLRNVRVPLDSVLQPIDVVRLEGELVGIDLNRKAVQFHSNVTDGSESVSYDRLIFAAGSRLVFPAQIDGLRDFSFSVDTYEAATRLNDHIASLPAQPVEAGQFTIVVAGAGLTGIETAAELPQKVKSLLGNDGGAPQWRIILVDKSPELGAAMGPSASPVIAQALGELGIEARTNAAVVSVTGEGATLSTGEFIPSRTIVWCGGMEASPATRLFPVEHDRYGRLPIDHYLRVKGVRDVFAAGDSARMMVDDVHESVMSCQHSRPMGRFAGHNAASDLLG